MTENEIVKAMICCTNFPVCDRDNCPYGESTNCATMLGKDVVELINRQKAEIERLRANLNIDLDNFASEYDSKIKAEAIEEFADRFKVKFAKERYRDNYVIDDEMLDNLVKEMVGEG